MQMRLCGSPWYMAFHECSLSNIYDALAQPQPPLVTLSGLRARAEAEEADTGCLRSTAEELLPVSCESSSDTSSDESLQELHVWFCRFSCFCCITQVKKKYT